MARTLLNFNIQLEHIGEVAVVIAVGLLLSASLLQSNGMPSHLRLSMSWFVPLLFFVIRPISVWVSLRGMYVLPAQKVLISWFGIRGIGSVYYVMAFLNRSPAAWLSLY
jgi:sodium/hydrogen antiporter